MTRDIRGRDQRQAERGATATIVALLLAGGVIMGMLAVSVDLGNLTYERRQVQNAADATSLALASECAADQHNCAPDEVEALLGANSHDGLSQYGSRTDAPNGACARGTAEQVGALSTVLCDSVGGGGDITDLLSCPPIPDWLAAESGIPYVETYADTQTASGDELFLPFSRVLAGGSSGDMGSSACARAAWGKPVGYSAALPITMSTCEWNAQVIEGTGFAPAPSGAAPGYGGAGQPPWPVAQEVAIALHKDGEDGCFWNEKDFPGGFGSLAGDDCTADVHDGSWAKVEPGNVPPACADIIRDLLFTAVDIPVFDCVVNSHGAPTGPVPSGAGACDPTEPASGGANTWYHLAGWAKFYLTGYRLGGIDSGTSQAPGGGVSCPGSGGSGRCLIGWYVKGALSDAPAIAPPGGPETGDFGAYVVKPAG